MRNIQGVWICIAIVIALLGLPLLHASIVDHVDSGGDCVLCASLAHWGLVEGWQAPPLVASVETPAPAGAEASHSPDELPVRGRAPPNFS